MDSVRPLETLAPDVPLGFRLGPGGLLVPAGDVTLERERWAWDEAKHLLRAYKVASARGLLFMIGCNDHRCAENPVINREKLPGGGFALRCQHKVRTVLERR